MCRSVRSATCRACPTRGQDVHGQRGPRGHQGLLRQPVLRRTDRPSATCRRRRRCPGRAGQGWAELTVGQAARVRVQLVDAKTRQAGLRRRRAADGSRATSRARRSGRRTHRGKTVAACRRHRAPGLPLPAREHGGSTAGVVARPVDGCARRPGARDLGLRRGQPDGWFPDLRLRDAAHRPAGRDGGPRVRPWGTSPVPVGSDHTVTVTAGGTRPDHGTGFLALYTLAP